MKTRPSGLLSGIGAVLTGALWIGASASAGTCPELGPVAHWTGGGTTAVPGFVAGEQWGATFEVPANEYPIEITRVGFGWGSLFGGSPQTLEQAIHIYAGGLSTPLGAPSFTLAGPVMTDGFINEFDISQVPGNRVINSGSFTVTIELANPSPPLGPAPVHDGNGCQGGGKNVIFAIPGGWTDVCTLGMSGDWQVQVHYRSLSCGPVTVGTPFCLGDGSDSPGGFSACPCGNIPALGSGEGCVLSTGSGAYIVGTGAPSVAADTLQLQINQWVPGELGIFVQNTSPGLMPFYDGVLCLATNSHLVRHYAPPAILPTVADAAGQGVNQAPLTVGDFLGDTVAGATVLYQFWGRDGSGPCSTGATFSSGLAVTWLP